MPSFGSERSMKGSCALILEARSAPILTASLRLKNVASVAIALLFLATFRFLFVPCHFHRSKLRASGRRVLPDLLLTGHQRFLRQNPRHLKAPQLPETFFNFSVFQRVE